MTVDFPARTRRRRKLDERLWVRFPALIHIPTAAVLRMSPRSRIRQRLVAYWARRSYEVVNRRDFELALVAQDPELVIRYAPDPAGRVPPDLIGEFRAGRVAEHEFFFDRDQAEEAAGLTGQSVRRGSGESRYFA
jgi:hypothetical protein